MSPIASDQTRPSASNDGVTRNANATWLNVWKFIVDVWYPLNAEVRGGAAGQSAECGERERLGQDRHEHRAGVESERSKRRDLSRARRHGGVHRQDGAENRPDGHQRGDGEPYGANERRQRLGL